MMASSMRYSNYIAIVLRTTMQALNAPCLRDISCTTFVIANGVLHLPPLSYVPLDAPFDLALSLIF